MSSVPVMMGGVSRFQWPISNTRLNIRSIPVQAVPLQEWNSAIRTNGWQSNSTQEPLSLSALKLKHICRLCQQWTDNQSTKNGGGHTVFAAWFEERRVSDCKHHSCPLGVLLYRRRGESACLSSVRDSLAPVHAGLTVGFFGFGFGFDLGSLHKHSGKGCVAASPPNSLFRLHRINIRLNSSWNEPKRTCDLHKLKW